MIHAVVIVFTVLLFAVIGAALVERFIADRHARYTDDLLTARDVIERMEVDQYAPTVAEARAIPADEFIPPPPGESVIVVGDYKEASWTVKRLQLNPQRVTIAEYAWKVDDLPFEAPRVIVLKSAIDLPQARGVFNNLRALTDARFVGLVI